MNPMARPEDVAEVNRITPIISQYLNTLQTKHVSVLSALAIIIAKTIDECHPTVTIDSFCNTIKGFYSNKEHLEFLSNVDELDRLLEQQRNPEQKTTPTVGQINVASVFDTRIQQLEQMGYGDMEILNEMHSVMPEYKALMDAVGQDGFVYLCDKFDGFSRFSKILRKIAVEIKSGEIKI
jgi:hypothetical protein